MDLPDAPRRTGAVPELLDLVVDLAGVVAVAAVGRADGPAPTAPEEAT